nr:protachykinin-like isoform X1 [Salvelinus alpinus]
MDIWKFQLVIVTLYSLVYTCQGLSFSVDKEHWVSKDWQDEPLEKRLASQVASLIKRSKAHQFYGLMGKRSDVQQQPIRVNRRRNKGEMFVGLMGRRASSGESFTRIIPDATSTAIDIAEGPHTQPGITYTSMLWLKPESTL